MGGKKQKTKEELEYIIYSGPYIVARIRGKYGLGLEQSKTDYGFEFVKIIIRDKWVGTIYSINNGPIRIKQVKTTIKLEEREIIYTDSTNPSKRKPNV